MTKRTPHILVIIQNFSLEHNAIRHACVLAEIFRCNLAVAFLKNKETPDSTAVSRKHKQLMALLPQTEIPVHSLLMDASEAEPNLSIQLLEVMYVVMQMDRKRELTGFSSKTMLKIMRRAKVPSIIVQGDTPIEDCYKKVFLPIGYQKINKEKMIWGSYFGRFYNARLFLLTANERTRELNQRINAMVVFTKNMYKQFSFQYEILTGKNKTNKIDAEAFQLARENETGLVVIMSSTHNNWLNDILGAPELKAILNSEKLPVMCINPNKDYYLPCN